MKSTKNQQYLQTLIKDPLKMIIIKQQHQETKYMGENLTKDLKDIYNKNYKLLMKDIEEDTNKWEGTYIDGL